MGTKSKFEIMEMAGMERMQGKVDLSGDDANILYRFSVKSFQSVSVIRC